MNRTEATPRTTADQREEPNAPQERLSPEWTLEMSGPYAFEKKGHSAAYSYLDKALHMRLLYQPQKGGFHQGVTFHLPDIEYGHEGRVEAAFAKATFSDEKLRCSTDGEDAYFAVTLERFSRDVRVGSFEGRLRCRTTDKADDRADEEPKYVDVSGRFQHD
ncbi:hypothetical protein [Persicimonas caeni]|uniref:hypothetical protein n=1 Tax=Persicimonas caeni TaxID=2292766 RepID=UPI00143CD512|nr:hypothetical protein [Persicimonas caeni]